MAKILVGICTVSPDQRFLESLPSFFRNVDKRHQLDCAWVFNKPLEEAQNELAEKVLAEGYDYLLTIEDDHYAFTPEMLDALLKADTYMIGVPYHCRHYPFAKVPMDYKYTDTALEGDRHDLVRRLEHVHPRVVIVEDAARLLDDRPTDRRHRVRPTHPRRGGLDHGELLGEHGAHQHMRPGECTKRQ